MEEKYVNALVDVVKTFLNFSDQWLEEDIIDSVTYNRIIKNKLQFVNEMQSHQG
jgi:hypothetical protein